MGNKTNLSGLANFRKRIEKYQNGTYSNRLLAEILKVAEQIALSEYNSISNIAIITENYGNSGKLIVEGSQVLFIEFGYGRYADGTYLGKLPNKGVPVSKSGGWEYYYLPSPYKRTSTITGKDGWFHKNKEIGQVRFYIGENAGNQMYRVAKELRARLPEIVKGVK